MSVFGDILRRVRLRQIKLGPMTWDILPLGDDSKEDVEDTIEPTNKPAPKTVKIEHLGNNTRVIVTWTYEQGEIPADRFVVFWAYGKQPTHTDESTMVSHTSRSFSRMLTPGEQCCFGIAAARGEKIGTIVTSQLSPDWFVDGVA